MKDAKEYADEAMASLPYHMLPQLLRQDRDVILLTMAFAIHRAQSDAAKEAFDECIGTLRKATGIPNPEAK